MFFVTITLDKSNYKSFEIRPNMIRVSKEYQDDVWLMVLNMSSSQFVHVGLKYCYLSTGYYECIKDLDSKRIEQMCNLWINGTASRGSFQMPWRPY